jgi:hypothetical protein
MLLIRLFIFCSLFLQGNSSYTDTDSQILYKECGLESLLSFDIFRIALKGMGNVDGLKNKDIITIIDFSKPSTKERFFVIDLQNKRLLYKSLVAHGKNSGGNMATSFSNSPRSLKSCLGFFITAETYSGKYGYSLKLDGLEPGVNDNARARGIVVHGADFVTAEIARQSGLLGRSYGCPALPLNKAKEIIDKISRGSCFFIYANDQKYLQGSVILNMPVIHPVADIPGKVTVPSAKI